MILQAWERWVGVTRRIDAAVDSIPAWPGFALLFAGLAAFCALAVVI